MHLAKVKWVVKYRSQELRRKPSLNRNVTPDTLMVPMFIDNTCNDLTTPQPDCLTAFCKVSTLHSTRNPLANLGAFDNFTQRIPPPSNTRSVAIHCNWSPCVLVFIKGAKVYPISVVPCQSALGTRLEPHMALSQTPVSQNP